MSPLMQRKREEAGLPPSPPASFANEKSLGEVHEAMKGAEFDKKVWLRLEERQAQAHVRDKMKYALFLGCMIPQRIPSVEIAAKKVFEKLGIEAIELQGYSCCPDSVVARLLDRKMWLTLAARNLSLAEEHGLDLLVLMQRML